jgi:molybdenum cofactor guanylyltransferase
MGGVDKGLITLHNKTLIQRTIEKLSPQVERIMLNANRNLQSYEALGHPVYTDTYDGFLGPLAGFHVALTHAISPYVAIVPCDSPFFPDHLIEQLLETLDSSDVDISYAVTYNDQLQKQTHPVFCLMRNNLKDHLSMYLESGHRKIDAWFAQLKCAEVTFLYEKDFMNINTPEDLANSEQRLFHE